MSRKAKYGTYDDQFKTTAVELSTLPGVQSQHVAEVLEIHPVMLYRWKKELREGKIVKPMMKGSLDAQMRRELKRLTKVEKAHETLKMEHELLKKRIQSSLGLKRQSSNSSNRIG
jgi:transposase